MNQIDKEIWETYKILKNKIKIASEKNDANECMEATSELWMFMNRFRNCDLQKYFDEDIYEWISNLKKDSSSKKINYFKDKKDYRIAFIVIYLNDLGGASIPHRFMLKDFKWEGNNVKNYFLISNFFKQDKKETDSLDYLKNKINPEEIYFLPKNLTHKERGDEIQKWLLEKKIDFVVAQLCPSTIYALSSSSIPLVANLSQDCYTFTLGPGFGDITYLVTLDQVFKYKFKKVKNEHYSKIIMLPLHEEDQFAKADKFNLKDLDIPENAILSGSTNMWKTFFGDGEILMEGIGALIRKYPNYHHIFIGTPRCLDNLESFIIKNPDLKNNIHYLGPVKNIYRILKCLDFWVNSFPTTGGSDIEMARIGKPTIDIAINRNLDLHPSEFLRFNDCIVISLNEFIALGSRYIEDGVYRKNIGEDLKNQISRQFNKENLVFEGIYKELIIEYQRRAHCLSRMPNLDISSTLDYEKRISFYNFYGIKKWTNQKKDQWLKECIELYPEKPFAWIKLVEQAILNKNFKEFKSIVYKIKKLKNIDYRLKVTLSYGYLSFKKTEEAKAEISKVLDLVKLDPIPYYIASKIELNRGNNKEAIRILKELRPEADNYNFKKILKKEFKDDIPLYYDY